MWQEERSGDQNIRALYNTSPFASFRIECMKKEVLGPALTGFLFEQVYQKFQEMLPPGQLAKLLDTFFG